MNARIPEYPGDGYTLLHVVLTPPPTVLEARRPGETLGTVELLLETGADPTIRDEHGRTSIELARENGFRDAVKLMEGVASKGQREEAVRRLWVWGFVGMVCGCGLF